MLVAKSKPRRSTKLKQTSAFSLAKGDTAQTVHLVRTGLPFKRLVAFQKQTTFPWETIARLISIPPRTLHRRQREGRLHPDESGRLWRASVIFDRAVELFEGDAAGAARWLQEPALALGGERPLDYAATEPGAREVENLIIRLEDGVFT